MAISNSDIAVIKGMLARGDRQSDIAAWFGGDVNSGRISEINTATSSIGSRAAMIPAASGDDLPPPGPYHISGRSALMARQTLEAVRDLINETIAELDSEVSE